MKRIIVLFLVIILLCGCVSTKKVEKKKKKKVEAEYVEHYKDLNNTPISFYSSYDSGLVKLTKINKNLVSMEDIGIFQIYPSTEDTVTKQ